MERATLQGHDVRILRETASPWPGDTSVWLRAYRFDTDTVVIAPAEYFTNRRPEDQD